MLTADQAREKMLSGVKPVNATHELPLRAALNKVISRDVTSSVNVPPMDNSAMDGFAVNHDEVIKDGITLPICQRITAGDIAQPLTPNSAARIFTGAEIPPNASAVVMQENCTFDDQKVTINQSPSEGQNIRRCGQDIKKNSTILKKGERISAQHIGLAASIGMSMLDVFREINVAIVSTGSELIEPGNPCPPGKIYNSNIAMLSALLDKLNCNLVRAQQVNDNFNSTRDELKRAAEIADLVISIGGVSVGEEDHVKAAVESIGQLDLWKIKIKPGKPIAFGSISQIPFVGLPGNPVSCFVSFLLFCDPIIRKIQGQGFSKPLSFFVPALFNIQRPRTRPEFVRVNVSDKGATLFENQSSGVLTSITWANAFALIPENSTVKRGDMIEIFPFEGIL